jgi:hypothetical protein
LKEELKMILNTGKEITIGKIKACKFFKISKLSKKLNLDVLKLWDTLMEIRKNTIKKTAEEITEEEKAEINNKATGTILNVIVKEIFEVLYLAEEEINDLVIDLTGLNKKEVAELEISEYIAILKEIITNSGFMGFFKQDK